MLNFDTNEFVERWAQAWNSRDLSSILAHFSDEAVFTSPIARQIAPETNGVVRGKQALREYWTAALDRNKNLHFEVTGIFLGVDSILIRFRNQDGVDRIEMLRFRDGLVVEGHGTFADPAAP